MTSSACCAALLTIGVNTVLHCAGPSLVSRDGELARRLGSVLAGGILVGACRIETLLKHGLADTDENDRGSGESPGYDWGSPEDLRAEAEHDQPSQRPKQTE